MPNLLSIYLSVITFPVSYLRSMWALDISATIGQCSDGYLIGYWAAQISYWAGPISYWRRLVTRAQHAYPLKVYMLWRPNITHYMNIIIIILQWLCTCMYSKTCLQGTLRRGDNLWSGDTFSEWYPIFSMLGNLWWRTPVILGHFLSDIEVFLEDRFYCSTKIYCNISNVIGIDKPEYQ